MRRLLLLAAAALALPAGAQTPGRSVTTPGGDGVMWRGDCVRTKEVRGKPDDPCPDIEDYSRAKRADLEQELKDRAQNPGKYRDRRAFLLWPPGANNDQFDRQWPHQSDFPSGWPRQYPVVVMYKVAVPAKPRVAPKVEGGTLAEALKALAGSPWTPAAKRNDGTPIDLKAATPEERGGRVIAQRPRPDESGTNMTLDLYVQPSVPPIKLMPVTRLLRLTPQQANARASRDSFSATRFDPVRQPEGRVEYQWPHEGTPAPAGSAIEYLVARAPANCPPLKPCPPPPPPEITRLHGETIVVDRPVPDPTWTEEIVVVTLGAGGAGAVGGYALMRVLRRRTQEEDEADDARAKPAAQLLNARVHPDRIGTQQVLTFKLRSAPDDPGEEPQ